MKRVCVFDVNETLLDLAALDGPFEHVFGASTVRREWFAQLLASAFLTTITGAYVDFGSLARGALVAVAERRGLSISDDDMIAILGTVSRLPPHPDVAPALDRLADAGFRLATLTNSTEAVAFAQLENANLAHRFERILSADVVERLKPAREPYAMAARELGIPIGEVRLVAAHGWDVSGAMAAGAAAAFVARPEVHVDPAADLPDIIGADLIEVADKIVAAEGDR